jgi:hypothetical protein
MGTTRTSHAGAPTRVTQIFWVVRVFVLVTPEQRSMLRVTLA